MNKQTYKFYHRLARIQRHDDSFLTHKRHCTRPFVFNCNIEDILLDAKLAKLYKAAASTQVN